MYHFEKVAILTQNCFKYLLFHAKTNEGEIGLYFQKDKKLLGGATSQKSQKEI